MKKLCMVLLIAASLHAQERRNFVGCPVVRDTKTTPCWLAEYKGEVYFLGIQGGVVEDFYPPQLSHEVLVEGTVAPGPRICGGIPLRPLKVSVLEEVNQACSTMLPAEDGIEAPARQRGPANSWLKIDGPNTTLYFDFDNDFLSYHTTTAISKAVEYFKANKSSRIEVTGSRGATLLSDGIVLTEKPGMGQIRARKVAEMIIGLGVPPDAVSTHAADEAMKPDGQNDAWNRRTTIAVKP